MILSVWRPKLKTINKKQVVFYYTICDSLDINVKGSSNLRVIYKCDDINCHTPNKIYAISRQHLNKKRSSTVNEDIQICKKCQMLGENNPRYGDHRSWEEIHGIEKSVKLKSSMSKRLKVNNPSFSEKVKKKRLKTNLENWGVENVFQSEKIISKIKETNMSKYGVDSFTKTEEYLQKTMKTNLRKYGVEWQSQSTTIRDKIIQSNFEKYGVDWVLQSGEIKKKISDTKIEKYGTDNHMSSDIFRKNKFIITSHPNYIKYISDSISLFKCDCGCDHNFDIESYLFTSRYDNNKSLCVICNPIDDKKSISKKELLKYISDVYDGELISGYRDRLEIDIYLPEMKLGFEFNGLYWHSELYKDKNYHLYKTNYFKDKGIRVIHIWEDDWEDNREIIKSMISNSINKSNKIYARKCEIKVINHSKISKKFLNDNHIQGVVNSSLKLGLFHENELVSIMTFDHFEGRVKMLGNEWNLNRFCNKLNTSVIGGASRLLKYFINNYEVSRIISYADKSWSEGGLYEKLKFDKLYESNPDYKYIVNNKRLHKSRFRKSVTKMNESDLGYTKIYDCGKIKYQYTL